MPAAPGPGSPLLIAAALAGTRAVPWCSDADQISGSAVPLIGHAEPGQTTGTIPTRDEFLAPDATGQAYRQPAVSPGQCQVRRPVLAAEIGRAGPGRPENVLGWPGRRITRETAAAYDGVIGAIDSARLPFLPGSIPPGGRDGGGGERTRTPAPATARTRPTGAAGMAARGAVSGRKGSVA